MSNFWRSLFGKGEESTGVSPWQALDAKTKRAGGDEEGERAPLAYNPKYAASSSGYATPETRDPFFETQEWRDFKGGKDQQPPAKPDTSWRKNAWVARPKLEASNPDVIEGEWYEED